MRIMNKYTCKCTCGHDMTLDAANKDEAVMKMKGMMTQEELDKHFMQFHKPDEMKPTLDMALMHIEQDIQQVVMPAPIA